MSVGARWRETAFSIVVVAGLAVLPAAAESDIVLRLCNESVGECQAMVGGFYDGLMAAEHAAGRQILKCVSPDKAMALMIAYLQAHPEESSAADGVAHALCRPADSAPVRRR